MQDKIFLNINDSNITVVEGKNTYYFSSNFNKRRFIERKKDYIDEAIRRIEIKYKVNINKIEGLDEKLVDYLLISLYTNIEKRGYKII